MNQILQYVMLAGVSAIVFGVMFSHFTESLELETISQYDKNEIEKKRASEYLKVIEIMDNPLKIDLINLGSDDVEIRKLFIDDIIDDNYLIDGTISNIIQRNKVVTIIPSITVGDSLLLISENYKKFKFR